MNSRALPPFAILISIGIVFAYVMPLWSGSIAQTRDAIANDDQALAAAAAYTLQQNKLATEKNAISRADLKRLETFLPSSVDNVGLILDLNALAARSSLSLSNIDVANKASENSPNGGTPVGGAVNTAASNPVGSVDLTLSAVGTYSALQNFLTGVERSGRLLDVHDLSVKGSNNGTYVYQMTVSLYWLR